MTRIDEHFLNYFQWLSHISRTRFRFATLATIEREFLIKILYIFLSQPPERVIENWFFPASTQLNTKSARCRVVICSDSHIRYLCQNHFESSSLLLTLVEIKIVHIFIFLDWIEHDVKLKCEMHECFVLLMSTVFDDFG